MRHLGLSRYILYLILIIYGLGWACRRGDPPRPVRARRRRTAPAGRLASARRAVARMLPGLPRGAVRPGHERRLGAKGDDERADARSYLPGSDGQQPGRVENPRTPCSLCCRDSEWNRSPPSRQASDTPHRPRLPRRSHASSDSRRQLTARPSANGAYDRASIPQNRPAAHYVRHAIGTVQRDVLDHTLIADLADLREAARRALAWDLVSASGRGPTRREFDVLDPSARLGSPPCDSPLPCALATVSPSPPPPAAYRMPCGPVSGVRSRPSRRVGMKWWWANAWTAPDTSARRLRSGPAS